MDESSSLPGTRDKNNFRERFKESDSKEKREAIENDMQQIEQAFQSLDDESTSLDALQFILERKSEVKFLKHELEYIPAIAKFLNPEICADPDIMFKVARIIVLMINDFPLDVCNILMSEEICIHTILWESFPMMHSSCVLRNILDVMTPSFKDQCEKANDRSLFVLYDFLIANGFDMKCSTFLRMIDMNIDFSVDITIYNVLHFIDSFSRYNDSVSKLPLTFDALIDILIATENIENAKEILRTVTLFPRQSKENATLLLANTKLIQFVLSVAPDNELFGFTLYFIGILCSKAEHVPADFTKSTLDVIIPLLEPENPFLMSALNCLTDIANNEVEAGVIVSNFVISNGVYQTLYSLLDSADDFLMKNAIVEAICVLSDVCDKELLSSLIENGLIDFIEEYMSLMTKIRYQFLNLVLTIVRYATDEENEEILDRIFENEEIMDIIEESVELQPRSNGDDPSLIALAIIQHDSYK